MNWSKCDEQTDWLDSKTPYGSYCVLAYGAVTIGMDLLTSLQLLDQFLHSFIVTVCHAEMNAIVNKNSFDVKGCTMYTTLSPCNECAKLIVQSGIRKIVYDATRDTKEWKAAAKLFEWAGVECV